MAKKSYGALAGTATSFENLPEDTYEAEITDSYFRLANSGANMWHVTFTITAGEQAGRKVFTNIVEGKSPEGASFFFGTCRSLGMDQQWFTDNVGDVDLKDEADVERARDAINEAFIGRTARIAVGDGKPYKGVTKSEVKSIKSLDGASAPRSRPSSDLPAAKPKKTAEEKAAKKAKKHAAAEEPEAEAPPAKAAKAAKTGARPTLPPGI